MNRSVGPEWLPPLTPPVLRESETLRRAVSWGLEPLVWLTFGVLAVLALAGNVSWQWVLLPLAAEVVALAGLWVWSMARRVGSSSGSGVS